MMQLVLHDSQFHEIMTGQSTIMGHANSSYGPGPDRIAANLQVYLISQSNELVDCVMAAHKTGGRA